MFFAGVDIGSTAVKVVMLDQQGKVVGCETTRTGYRGAENAWHLLKGLLAAQTGVTPEVWGRQGGDPAKLPVRVVATGYGRHKLAQAHRQVSEITCHARGAYHLEPGTATVIDIGGQDSKVIRVAQGGTVLDFAMNDKCAAGTGRFLEVVAGALEENVDSLGRLAVASNQPVAISSTCTVFAESEVVSHIAAGSSKENIAAGLCLAVAERVAGMAGRIGVQPRVVMTGGVAHNRGVVRALATMLGLPVEVLPDPHLVGALGAALLARDAFANNQPKT